MVRVLVEVLETSEPVSKVGLPRQSAVRERLESPEDRRIADFRICLPNQAVEFIRTEVALGLEKSLDHKLALSRSSQAFLLDVLCEYF